MLCCQGCNLETETTLTAVLFVDQLASQRTNILTKYAHKHLKNIATNHNKYSHRRPSRDNKENQPQSSNRGREALRTIRKCPPLVCSELTERQEDICQTGRFKGGREVTQGSSYRQSKRNLDSKTTSFGSLVSRASNSDFLRRAEFKLLQQELDTLREEEMSLLREKLQKDYQCRREMLRLGALRDNLQGRSQQRQAQLLQLKQLLSRKTGCN